MKLFPRIFPALIILFLLSAGAAAQDAAAQNVTASLLVKTPEESVARLVAFAEERGGYFLYTDILASRQAEYIRDQMAAGDL